MKIIYQTKYLTESFAQGNEAADATAPEIEKALSESLPSFSEDFLQLSLLCLSSATVHASPKNYDVGNRDRL